MIEKVLLVTGAPRSGTTPVGHMLSMVPGAFELYEPMGPTGDCRFVTRFPIPGEPTLPVPSLVQFVEDMRRLRLRFKPQRRPGHRQFEALFTRFFGTRSLRSYRLAKLQRHKRLLIWKDPHAVFCASSSFDLDFRAVVSIRSPHAHAASFKRLGWISGAKEIYPRYRAEFGEIAGFEDWIERVGDTPVGSAALLWHLIHQRFVAISTEARGNVYLFNMEKVAKDERSAYQALFSWLGESMPQKAEDVLSSRNKFKTRKTMPNSNTVHDFNRSAAQANSYWQKVLSKKEIELVSELNSSLWGILTA
ncbi:hypothetical protein [Rhodopirellula sp. P2]|uniref:hypothetical protein n=1 Tax=Rhodopirellula sp. P2 TaxID=2127060 RepID=UPI002368087F|nr:hypothetical protein [Rhodopirellula sp. P2]WDQ17485.1 hypothetical protein PSR62_02775 [Rhodopirellula sp. P2]